MLVQAILAVVGIAAILQPVIAYLRDSRGLRKFPAPSYAGLSSIWRIIQNLKTEHYLAVHEAHKKFGTHVRIAPNHISVSDPKALSDIYGHGANFLKDAWYDGGAGEHRHMADSRVKAEHQAKRKLLAHVFAQKTIANLEPVIADTVGTLTCQLDRLAVEGKPVNMRRYLNYFTIDVFSRILYGESLKCLERGDDMVTAETTDGKVYKAPFIKSLHDATVMNTILGMEAGLLPLTRKLLSWHPYKKAGADYDNIIYHNTAKRLHQASDDSYDHDDIFSKLLINNKGESVGLGLGEILAEASVMMNAGTDTTTAALTNTIYLLYKNPSVLAKVRAELEAATGATEIPNYEELASLPYLRACVEESLRVRPASSFGLPRVVPKGGRVIAGQFVAEDVTVSVPTYTLLRNPECFAPNPEAFWPDRWIIANEKPSTGETDKNSPCSSIPTSTTNDATDPEKAINDQPDRDRMAKAHFPFSVGPRACIGRNIAYFEQLLVIAALVKGYDFEFVEGPDFELKTFERFNSNPGEMEMKIKKRTVY